MRRCSTSRSDQGTAHETEDRVDPWSTAPVTQSSRAATSSLQQRMYVDVRPIAQLRRSIGPVAHKPKDGRDPLDGRLGSTSFPMSDGLGRHTKAHGKPFLIKPEDEPALSYVLTQRSRLKVRFVRPGRLQLKRDESQKGNETLRLCCVVESKERSTERRALTPSSFARRSPAPPRRYRTSRDGAGSASVRRGCIRP